MHYFCTECTMVELALAAIYILSIVIISPYFLLRDKEKILNYEIKIRKNLYEKHYPHLARWIYQIESPGKISYQEWMGEFSSRYKPDELRAIESFYKNRKKHIMKNKEYKEKNFLSKALSYYKFNL